MILDEVRRFRQLVRSQAQQAVQNPAGGVAVQGSSVPIPDHNQQWSIEDPRPQEAYNTNTGELESELQKGMDAMHQ